MRVIVVTPFHHAGRGWAIGETLDVEGEDLQLLIRGNRVEPANKKGWRRFDRPPNITWDAHPEAEIARPAPNYGGRVW